MKKIFNTVENIKRKLNIMKVEGKIITLDEAIPVFVLAEKFKEKTWIPTIQSPVELLYSEVIEGNLESKSGFTAIRITNCYPGSNLSYAIIPKDTKCYDSGDIIISEKIIVFKDSIEFGDYIKSHNIELGSWRLDNAERKFILRQGDVKFLNKRFEYSEKRYKPGEEMCGEFILDPNLENKTELTKKEKFVKFPLGARYRISETGNIVVNKIIICA